MLYLLAFSGGLCRSRNRFVLLLPLLLAGCAAQSLTSSDSSESSGQAQEVAIEDITKEQLEGVVPHLYDYGTSRATLTPSWDQQTPLTSPGMACLAGATFCNQQGLVSSYAPGVMDRTRRNRGYAVDESVQYDVAMLRNGDMLRKVCLFVPKQSGMTHGSWYGPLRVIDVGDPSHIGTPTGEASWVWDHYSTPPSRHPSLMNKGFVMDVPWDLCVAVGACYWSNGTAQYGGFTGSVHAPNADGSCSGCPLGSYGKGSSLTCASSSVPAPAAESDPAPPAPVNPAPVNEAQDKVFLDVPPTQEWGPVGTPLWDDEHLVPENLERGGEAEDLCRDATAYTSRCIDKNMLLTCDLGQQYYNKVYCREGCADVQLKQVINESHDGCVEWFGQCSDGEGSRCLDDGKTLLHCGDGVARELPCAEGCQNGHCQ